MSGGHESSFSLEELRGRQIRSQESWDVNASLSARNNQFAPVRSSPAVFMTKNNIQNQIVRIIVIVTGQLSIVDLENLKEKLMDPYEGWANYGPGAECGPINDLIWLTKRE